MDISKLPPISDFPHSIPVQLRFNDVDVLGHVNNTVYFSFYDTAKAAYFSAVRHEAIDWQHVDTVIANVDCAFAAPIFFSEKIRVYSRCMEVGEKSFRIQQVIIDEISGQVKSAAETVMVCIDPATMKSRNVPEKWRNLLLTNQTNG